MGNFLYQWKWRKTLLGMQENMEQIIGKILNFREKYRYFLEKMKDFQEKISTASPRKKAVDHGEKQKSFLFTLRNEVIYSSSPISWPSFKPLAQIAFEIYCWQV